MKTYNLEQFKATGNPIYAWWAYRHARNNGEQIPTEVLEYFDGVADSLLLIASEHRKASSLDPKMRRVEIVRALGLSTTNPFNAYERDQKYLMFISKMEDSLCAWLGENDTKHGWEDSLLPELAKEHDISKSTARRLFEEYLKRERKLANAQLPDTYQE